MADLSKKFQEDQIDLSIVNPHVDVSLAKLQGMLNQPGSCLKDFLDNVTCVNDHSQCSYRDAIYCHAQTVKLMFLKC